MNPSYHYKMDSGTRLFRATTIEKKGRWFSLSLEDAYTYGKNITEYSTINNLNLLNITSLSFHIDFIDRLNIMFPGIENTGLDENKLKCLIPLGLVDFYSQQSYLKMLNSYLPIDTTKWNDTLELLNTTFQNRHRLSEHGLDTYLVSILEKIYGTLYDGYISPIKWPSKYYGGLFPREVCLFNYDTVKEENVYIRPNHFGGGLSNTIGNTTLHKIVNELNSHKFIPFWNPHTEEKLWKPNLNKTRKQKTNRK